MSWTFFVGWLFAVTATVLDLVLALSGRPNIWKTGFDVILLISWTAALLASTEPDP
jgi:hypothetical protein